MNNTAPSDTPGIETTDLTRTFKGGIVAVDGLDLAVPRGTVYGLIGRNGAGKTTALRLLMGLLVPDRGTARILGRNMWMAPRRHRQQVAYVCQHHRLHGWMTLAELCDYLSCLYETWDQDLAQRLVRRFDLPWQRQVEVMSGGQQRMAAVLLAFAARPQVLLLDEPGAGLDPIARRLLLEQLVDHIAEQPETTVLLSTHQLSDLERVAEHVGILQRGRLLLSARLDELQGSMRRVQVIFDAPAAPPDFQVPGALRSRVDGPVVTAVVRLVSDSQLDGLRRRPDVRINEFPLSLEDLFIELLGREATRQLQAEASEVA